MAGGQDKTIPLVAYVKLIRERPDMKQGNTRKGSLDDVLQLMVELGI